MTMSRFPCRILLLRRRHVAFLAALAAAAGIFYAVRYPASVSAAATSRQLPIYSVERPQKMCALSFDAAWGNQVTPLLIETLAKYDIKATFFVMGEWAEEYPDSVKALAEAGHEVMNHSDTHEHYNSFSAQEIIADVSACNEKIAAITGVTPTLIRCPFGEYDDHVISAIRSMGMEPIQWDVDSLDWKDTDPDSVCQRVTEKVRSGSIVLFHNAAAHTAQALPQVLECLIREGYTIVPISQLIYTENYTIDHTGRQFPAETSTETDTTE